MLFAKEDNFSKPEPELLFKQLYPRLCNFANCILKDGDLAEDIVQDAFANYFERRDFISNDITAIKSFLYTSIKNACLNNIRHVKVVDQYNKNNPLDICSDPKILERIIHAEVIAQIHDAIAMLPKGCALVIRYGYLEGLSNTEIADLMNISIHTVKSQKKRALAMMKMHLGKAALSYLVLLFVNSNFF